jgi:cytoskeletal protein RodZ
MVKNTKKIKKPSPRNKIKLNEKVIADLSLGALLKTLRQKRKMSLEQASKRLKISTHRLKLIENDNLTHLPAPVYIRGYLKQYAVLFKFKEDVLLAKFENQLTNSKNIDLELHKPIFQINPQKGIFRFRSLLALILAVFFVFTIGYIFWQVSAAFSPPEIILTSPTDDLALNQASVMVSGHTEINVDLTINGQTVYPNEEGYFDQEISLKEGLNIIQVRVVNGMGKISSITRKVLYSRQ